MNEINIDVTDLLSPENRFAHTQSMIDRLSNSLSYVEKNAPTVEQRAAGIDMCVDKACDDFESIYPWFEDSMVADTLSAIREEIISLNAKTIVSLGVVGVTKALKKGVSTFLLARFNAYTALHSELIPITEIQYDKYDLMEAMDIYNVKFQVAYKWAEKLDNRVETRVYKFNRKPLFVIAYGKLSSGAMYNTEFVILDKSIAPWRDFYTASAHAHVGIGHPSITRLLTDIATEWKIMEEKNKAVIEEAAIDSIMSGTYSERINNVITGVRNGFIPKESAKVFIEEMEQASYDTEDDSMFFWE